MTVGMENLNPQNDPGLWPIKITDVDRTDIVLKGPIRVKVDLFPCRIFGLENTKIGSSEGACDWKHLGDYLKSHESSRQHKDSSHNLAFRGHREKLTSDSDSRETSANFIYLVKLIARFEEKLTSDSDSRETSANFIYLVKLIARLDPVLRPKTTEIEEHFIGFLAVEKTTAESLSNYIITELEQLGISLQNCRGQGYDNGANMRGEKSAVQKRILDINPLAYFLPCGSPSWNLILGDAALSCFQAKSFFGLLQRLYTLVNF
ncbi:hypothetical protein QE152_g37908 [Popillia japonica]|uniref:DUF4371 domain-containing protein n=1 Tax=Popillia japonica TaxID=7064 RepID=A0AAW1I8N3_POPJA